MGIDVPLEALFFSVFLSSCSSLVLLLFLREKIEESSREWGRKEGRKGLGCFSLSSGSFKVLLH